MKLLVGKSGHLVKIMYFPETKELPPNLKQHFKLFHIANVVSESLTKIFTQKNPKLPPPPSIFALNTALSIVLILTREKGPYWDRCTFSSKGVSYQKCSRKYSKGLSHTHMHARKITNLEN